MRLTLSPTQPWLMPGVASAAPGEDAIAPSAHWPLMLWSPVEHLERLLPLAWPLPGAAAYRPELADRFLALAETAGAPAVDIIGGEASHWPLFGMDAGAPAHLFVFGADGAWTERAADAASEPTPGDGLWIALAFSRAGDALPLGLAEGEAEKAELARLFAWHERLEALLTGDAEPAPPVEGRRRPSARVNPALAHLAEPLAQLRESLSRLQRLPLGHAALRPQILGDIALAAAAVSRAAAPLLADHSRPAARLMARPGLPERAALLQAMRGFSSPLAKPPAVQAAPAVKPAAAKAQAPAKPAPTDTKKTAPKPAPVAAAKAPAKPTPAAAKTAPAGPAAKPPAAKPAPVAAKKPAPKAAQPAVSAPKASAKPAAPSKTKPAVTARPDKPIAAAKPDVAIAAAQPDRVIPPAQPNRVFTPAQPAVAAKPESVTLAKSDKPAPPPPAETKAAMPPPAAEAKPVAAEPKPAPVPTPAAVIEVAAPPPAMAPEPPPAPAPAAPEKQPPAVILSPITGLQYRIAPRVVEAPAFVKASAGAAYQDSRTIPAALPQPALKTAQPASEQPVSARPGTQAGAAEARPVAAPAQAAATRQPAAEAPSAERPQPESPARADRSSPAETPARTATDSAPPPETRPAAAPAAATASSDIAELLGKPEDERGATKASAAAEAACAAAGLRSGAGSRPTVSAPRPKTRI